MAVGSVHNRPPPLFPFSFFNSMNTKVACSFLLFLFFVLSCFPLSLNAQQLVHGRVVDARTSEPLAFVNLRSTDGLAGTSTDIDGKFLFRTQKPGSSVLVSYVGYEPMRVDLVQDKEMLIRMVRKQIELEGVTILPGENPALRIIRQVIAHRDSNDHEKLSSFRYEAYEKMVFAINADSIMLTDPALLDTSSLKLRNFIEKRDLFMIENVVERTFKAPDRNVEKVLATHMSGFRDPVFVFLLSQLQTTTFYKEELRIGDRTYISPLTNGSLNRYFYQLEDTLLDGHDSVFVISFRPWKGTRFDGLKGTLSVSTDGWAVVNVIAEPAVDEKAMSIKIQQLYHKPDSLHWFPRQLNTDLVFKNLEVQAGKNPDTRFHMLAQGRTYIKDTQINPDIKSRELSMLGTDIDPNAAMRDAVFWDQHRIDSLTARELETYRFIDSLGRKANFDRLARMMETAMDGRIPMGFIDLDLNRLFRYNNYEGWYAGLGLVTSKRLSTWFSVNGFWGYGFRDKTAKYGGGLELMLNRRHEVALAYQYTADISEDGHVVLPFGNRSLVDETFFREILTNRFDAFTRHEVSLKYRALRHFLFQFKGISERNQPMFDYQFSPVPQSGRPLFQFSELSLGVRFAFRERFLRTVRNKISMGSDYPVALLSITRGFDNVLSGEFSYNKVDLKVTASTYFRFLGRSSVVLLAGIADGEVPLGRLYNAPAAYTNFSVQSPESFATMRINEFYSDRYAALFISHDFENLLFRSKWFNPRPELRLGALWGSMKHLEQHQGVKFQVPDNGYFEAGININNIINLQFYNLGLGAMWRLGCYSLPETIDNLSVNITFKWSLGK